MTPDTNLEEALLLQRSSQSWSWSCCTVSWTYFRQLIGWIVGDVFQWNLFEWRQSFWKCNCGDKLDVCALWPTDTTCQERCTTQTGDVQRCPLQCNEWISPAAAKKSLLLLFKHRVSHFNHTVNHQTLKCSDLHFTVSWSWNKCFWRKTSMKASDLLSGCSCCFV